MGLKKGLNYVHKMIVYILDEIVYSVNNVHN